MRVSSYAKLQNGRQEMLQLLGALLFINLLSEEDEEPKERHKRINWVQLWLAR